MEIKLIDVKQVAEILGVSTAHAYQLVNAKEIPSVNLAKPNTKARRLKVNMEDLENFIKQGGVQDGTR